MAEAQLIFVAGHRGMVGASTPTNTYPADSDLIHDNLVIETNAIHAAFQTGVHRLLFLGSSCIYPRKAPQPMAEEALLTGPLEPPISPTPLPRSLALGCARATTARTASTTAA